MTRCGDMEAPVSALLGGIGSLLRKLDLLLESSEEVNRHRFRLHKGAKYGMYLLKDDLEEISSYLQDLSDLEDPPLIAKCWMKEARELSYHIEDYIDRFVFSGHVANIKTRSCCRRIRHIKIGRLLEANKKVSRRKRVAPMISDFRIYAQEAIERHKRYELDCCNYRRRISHARRLPASYEVGADIIIDSRMSKFIYSLANDKDQRLKVVSVVGFQGIGKTTFVELLYNKLKGQFDCRAFVRLTQKPCIKTILGDILTQVERQQHSDHCGDPDLISRIREKLQHKRYLIVIDDLWSATIWDVISHAFSGGRSCSRIITTTQVEDVALACCCYHSEDVFEMRPLDDYLSTKLFLNCLFCSESDFPEDIKQLLNKIVRKCGGSPLATTIIARLLASHPVMSLEQWTYVCDSLSFNLGSSSTSEGLLKLIVNFSYNNLTHDLKTCLLYLTMYPEGCTVCKDDLVKQWVAEGFIDTSEGREVEIAESYFHELIARRFLQPAGMKYNSEVVSCSVHDVVRDLIVQKSLEENFIILLDCFVRDVAISEKVHRLSLHFPLATYARTNIKFSQVRSLAYFGLSKCIPPIREFKLLRVLNLGLYGHDAGDDVIYLTAISELLQLRFLKVASDVCIELPKHMRGLQCLETLDISTKVTHIPWDIIYLPCLLHLHLPFETNLMDWIGAIPASMWSLGRLTNLQCLYLTCSMRAPDHLQRNMEALCSLLGGHGNLNTLVLILGSAHKKVVHGPLEVTVSWYDFAPSLLQRFEWSPHILTFSRVPMWMRKLHHLCILKISVRELLGDDIKILGELPALTALLLYVQMVPIKRIVFDKAAFSVLKYFKFMCSTVPCLKFEVDTMPNLQRLKLGFSVHRVDQHDSTPIIIEHLPGLKEIAVKVGDASSNVETATAAISNHPRNPRIKMQLVDWNFSGAGVWYTLNKQKETRTLEEDGVLEEGLNEQCVPQDKDSSNDEKKEAYVRTDLPARQMTEAAPSTTGGGIGAILAAGNRDFLIRNSGEQVKISSIEANTVALYFSASWCPPCRRFTPKLIEIYKELASHGKSFEVVFVSGDNDEEAFNAYFAKMPWLAVPFSDSEGREGIDGQFKVSGIPHLVIHDARTGEVYTEDGVEFVSEYGVEAYPFTPERINELKEQEKAAKDNQTIQRVPSTSTRGYLISNKGDRVPISDLEGKYVGLFFVVGGYGPVDQFSSVLAKIYEKLKEVGVKFEVVAVPLESDESSFNENFAKMPWLAIPQGDKMCEKLVRYFELSSLPTLVLIGPDGKTLNNNVADIIEEHGFEAWEGFPFSAEKLEMLAEKSEAKAAAQTLESLLIIGDLDFVIGKDGAKVPVTKLVGKTVLLHFSAKWCGPCRAFLPRLVKEYNKIKEKNSDFEIVFISSDRDESSFDDFFSEIPWLALPFGDERIAFLRKTFRILGIPSLVAIGPTGQTVNEDAKTPLMMHGSDAFPFTEERLEDLQKKMDEMAKGWPEKLKHEMHEEHELVLKRGGTYGCDGCEEMGSIWSYRCDECDFDLHPKCALAEKEDKGEEDGKAPEEATASYVFGYGPEPGKELSPGQNQTGLYSKKKNQTVQHVCEGDGCRIA